MTVVTCNTTLSFLSFFFSLTLSLSVFLPFTSFYVIFNFYFTFSVYESHRQTSLALLLHLHLVCLSICPFVFLSVFCLCLSVFLFFCLLCLCLPVFNIFLCIFYFVFSVFYESHRRTSLAILLHLYLVRNFLSV
jgi:hypothetical protein